MMAAPKHVVLYVPDLSVGGAERAALNLLEALPGPDLRVTLLLNQRRGPLIDALLDGTEVRSLDVHRTIAALPRLTAFLRRERPDVLISYLEFNNIVAIWANHLAGRPTKVIASHHVTMSSVKPGSGSWKYRLVPAIYRFTLPWADHVVAVSKGVASGLAQVMRGQGSLSIIDNPIITLGYRELAAAPLEHPWFAPAQPPIILGVGRLVPQKNFELLINAFAELAVKSNARLALLGDGPLKIDLQQQIDRLGLSSRATILPIDLNPWRYMARANVLVLSSLFEGFGNVLVEAMATGTPVVSVDCPDGPADILGHGKWGRLVPSGDAKALAAAIEQTLADPGDPQSRRARALEYSAQSIAMRYRDLIARLDEGRESLPAT